MGIRKRVALRDRVRRLLGVDEPTYGLAVFGDDNGIWKLSEFERGECKSWGEHRRVRAIDGVYKVLPYLVCTRCRGKLGYPNTGAGMIVLVPGWKNRIVCFADRFASVRRLLAPGPVDESFR